MPLHFHRINAVRAFMACLLALTAWLAAWPVHAGGNSPQAAESLRQYREAKARGEYPEPERVGPSRARQARSPARRAAPDAEEVEETQNRPRPFSSGANPRANPNLSLKSCLDHVGINPVARSRCMRQHCQGRWGKGQCPEGGDLLSHQGNSARTPLGQCLRQAGNNPFKRNACGWKHCNKRWDAAECRQFKVRQPEPAN